MQHSITLIITTLIGAVFGALPTSDLDATQHSVLKEWAIPEERAIAHEWVDLSDDQTHTTYFHDAVAFASIADVHARDDDPTYKDGWKGPNIVKTAQCARDTMRFENLTGARGNGDAFLSDCTAMTKYVIERDAIWDLDGTTFSNRGQYVSMVWHGRCSFGIFRQDFEAERLVINTIDIGTILDRVVGSVLKFATQSEPRKVEADGFMVCGDNPVGWSVYNKDALDQDQVDFD